MTDEHQQQAYPPPPPEALTFRFWPSSAGWNWGNDEEVHGGFSSWPACIAHFHKVMKERKEPFMLMSNEFIRKGKGE